MKIQLLGHIVDLELIYKITPIYKEIYDNNLSLLWFTVHFMDDKDWTITLTPTELMRQNDEPMIKLHPINYPREIYEQEATLIITNTRSTLITLWNEGNSKYPVIEHSTPNYSKYESIPDSEVMRS